MRRIDRSIEPRKLALLRGAAPNRTWDSSGAGDVHDAIREKLCMDQEQCCAYCERPLNVKLARVEHIHPRSAPQPCAERPSDNHHYDWNNLLVVCSTNGTCDEAKDNKHLCADILFPDRIEVDLVFLIDTRTGALIVSPSLPAAMQAKASRTIQELKLDDRALRDSRRAVVAEFERLLFGEKLSPHQVSFEMRSTGFPTTVEAMRRNFG